MLAALILVAVSFVPNAAVRGVKCCGNESKSAVELKMQMRKLWEDHIAWTRLYIVSAVNGLDSTDKYAARLLKNQEDIGNAIKPVYGDAAGDKLTALLKDHILLAAELVKAAKAGDSARRTSCGSSTCFCRANARAINLTGKLHEAHKLIQREIGLNTIA